MAAFTHYWKNKTWAWHEDEGKEGLPLNHTAGNQFHKRGVHAGDRVYVVTVLRGKLFVLGRMTVSKIQSQHRAEEQLGEDLWDANEQVMADQCTPMCFTRRVPDAIVKELRFLSRPHEDLATKRIVFDERPLVFTGKDELHEQTLRGVRRLAPESARLFDSLID